MVGERRVILLTVDERPTSDKLLDWAVDNMYRVSELLWSVQEAEPLQLQQLVPGWHCAYSF